MAVDVIDGCDICGENKISFKRADDIYVCDKCNKRYPIKDDK